MTTSTVREPAPPGGAKPVLDSRRPRGESALVHVFVLIPMPALVAAVPQAWGWGLSMALQGDVITWVADHRRHHAFTDKEGDPHSPWLFGTSPAALAQGFWHAHTGWTLGKDRTNAARFTPDLLADRDITRIAGLFPLWTAVSLRAPAVLGRLLSIIWALEKLGWAFDVRWPTPDRLARLTTRPTAPAR